MKAIIQVSKVLHEGAVTGRHSGRLLRESVVNASHTAGAIQVDFTGVNMITQSAADEFIGRIIRQQAHILERVSFSNCTSDVETMLQWAAEHANAVFANEDALVAA